MSVRSVVGALALGFVAVSSAQASQVVNCVGENAKEKLQFVMDGDEGITLTYVSSALCDGYTAIADDEESVFVSETKDKDAKTVLYDTWEGNWGWKIKLPNKIAGGYAESGTRFKAGYRFDYNDIAEATLVRTLDCKLR